MQNVYSRPTSDLRSLWLDKHAKRLFDLYIEYSDQFSTLEMLTQVKERKGIFANAYFQEIRNFTNNTVNVEIGTALTLVDLYFGVDTQTEIGFIFKQSYCNEPITSYDDLIKNIESYTCTDFLLKCGKKGVYVQLKRFRQDARDMTTNSLKKFIFTVSNKYGGNLPNTVLAVLLQPQNYEPNGLDFKTLSKILIKNSKKLAFPSVVVTFNGDNIKQYLVQLYPEFGVRSEKIVWLSEEMQKKVQSAAERIESNKGSN
jgi:hypothetical protein